MGVEFSKIVYRVSDGPQKEVFIEEKLGGMTVRTFSREVFERSLAKANEKFIELSSNLNDGRVVIVNEPKQ